jgi:hypothetical protein
LHFIERLRRLDEIFGAQIEEARSANLERVGASLMAQSTQAEGHAKKYRPKG